jgi:hypothetical protein
MTEDKKFDEQIVGQVHFFLFTVWRFLLTLL